MLRGTVALLSLTIQGFQSYRDPQTIGFDPHLTLVAGRNDVGKTALLRVLRIFTQAQEGPHENFELAHQWSVTTEELLGHVLAGSSSALVDWFQERDGHTLAVTYRRTNDNAAVAGSDLQATRIHLVELDGLAIGDVGSQPGWTSGPLNSSAAGHEIPVRLAQTLAANIAYIGPRSIPEGSRQLGAEQHLQADAGNLANVLHTLHSNRDPPVFDAIETFMRRAFPSIDRIAVRLDLGTSPLSGQTAVFYRHAPDTPILLQHTGSGIGQMLALSTGVLTNRTGRLFLIDEPQAFLHPQAEHELLALLEEHDEHQYVIATHSNFLLNSRPLSHARLLRLEGGATVVLDATRDALLSELGITAADLWLAERILWVEGSSEVSVFERLLEELPAGQRAGVRIKKMPIASSLFVGRGSPGQLSFRFLEEVIDATRETPVRMRFLFDRDEKTEAELTRLEAASGGRADILPRRELENLFLDAKLVQAALAALCEQAGREPPDPSVVATRLGELLAETGNDRLFPEGVPDGVDAVAVSKGSRLLSELWWEFATAEYDKGKHGEALAQLALEAKPELLEPLRDVLRTLLMAPSGA